MRRAHINSISTDWLTGSAGMHRWYSRLACLCAALTILVSLTACAAIDEDLSDCEEVQTTTVDYDLRLVTNVQTELETQLSLQADVALQTALREYLSGIFTDFAHDVVLSFYDVAGDSTRLHEESHVMDANEESFTLTLPRREYMHTAVANLEGNDVLGMEGANYCHTQRLWQSRGDTIPPHTTGIFTARRQMNIREGVSQTFDVHLYMANCAAALVLDPRGTATGRIRIVSTGFASRFNIADSTYTYALLSPIVKADRIEAPGSAELCYCTVNFPSRDLAGEQTRTVIETTEPFVTDDADDTFWEIRAYVTNDDGKVTETRLGIRQPLRAGQLKIIRGWVATDGSVKTSDQEVSTSVTLDWKEGLVIGN